MKTTIYVQLINEGTTVYRPVEAEKMINGVYKILQPANYNFLVNELDEQWEFPPDSLVVCRYQEQSDTDERILVADHLI